MFRKVGRVIYRVISSLHGWQFQQTPWPPKWRAQILPMERRCITDNSRVDTTQYQSTILLHQSLKFYSLLSCSFCFNRRNPQIFFTPLAQEEAPVAAPVQVLPPETLLAAGASKASAPAPPGEAGGADPSTAPAMAAMPGAAMPGAGVPMPGAAAAAAAMMPGGDPFDLKRPGKTHGK